RANVYPTREFLARGRQDIQVKICQHCQAESETCSCIIGYWPAVQEARIKRHNQLYDLVFHKPLLRDHQNELYKPDLKCVKGGQALVVDITIRYKSKLSLADAAAEKVRKYQHLREQVQEVTNADNIEFVGFPIEALVCGMWGKWYGGNYRLLSDLGLSKTQQEKVARLFSRRALFTSVDIVHIF
ncbi:hypothetical protein FQV24_0000332, partial [Spheniscus mendiculus]